MLSGGQSYLTCSDPGARVEVMVGSSPPRTPLKRRPSGKRRTGEVIAEEHGQLGMNGHDAAIAIGTMLEL